MFGNLYSLSSLPGLRTIIHLRRLRNVRAACPNFRQKILY